MIHRALQRQQAKPESERARVALVLDEARMVATPTVERMLSMDRSAGIEIASAWQFSEQIRARDVRAGMLALHRNLAVFACGQADARELSDLLLDLHDDRLSGEPAERERHPFAPDALTNMPVHHAAAKLVVRGSKVAPFTYETPPMPRSPSGSPTTSPASAPTRSLPRGVGRAGGVESDAGSALASDLWDEGPAEAGSADLRTGRRRSATERASLRGAMRLRGTAPERTMRPASGRSRRRRRSGQPPRRRVPAGPSPGRPRPRSPPRLGPRR